MLDATESGIIDYNSLQARLEEMRKKELLKMHQFKVWETGSGKFKTYLPDEEKGRVLIQAQSREKIEQRIIEFYRIEVEDPSVDQVFKKWIEKKIELDGIEESSAAKYTNEYNRFFETMGFKKRKIKRISEELLENFILLNIRQFQLTRKTYGNLRTIIIGIFKYAKKQKLTAISITSFFKELDIPKTAFTVKIIDPKTQIFTDNESKVIKNYLLSHPTITNLGLLLLFQTGLRVGELSALLKTDVKEDHLEIHNTESRKKVDGHYVYYVKDNTKTPAGTRTVWLPESAKETIRMINDLGYNGQWLFTSPNGNRIKSRAFYNKLDDVLKTLRLAHRSPHKIRKTYGSLLIDNGCEESLVKAQMGHTNILTTKTYYYYSTRTNNNRKEQIERAVDF